MISPPWKDHFSGHADEYRAYRPAYPPELFAFLAQITRDHDLVWDCATGNGQAAVGLARYFQKVIATDASAEQISNAELHPRVEYIVAPAEKCPLPDNSVGLITVAQALHWLDLDGFYSEVRRVARPCGMLAVWTYDLNGVDPAVDRVLDRLRNEFVGPYWPPERALVDAAYRTIPFPFEDEPVPPVRMSADWDLARLTGYLGTWSATKTFVKVNGFDPVARLTAELSSAWGAPATIRTVTWRFSCRLGRVSKS